VVVWTLFEYSETGVVVYKEKMVHFESVASCVFVLLLLFAAGTAAVLA
jgi:hypothetical protein